MSENNELIIVKILDLETGEITVTDKFPANFWVNGSGQCDCNRRLAFPVPAEKPMPDGECDACNRYLIIEADTGLFSLKEFNRGYLKG